MGGPLAAEVRSLTILHTNDLHARLLPLTIATAVSRRSRRWFAANGPIAGLHLPGCRRPGAGHARLHPFQRPAGLRNRKSAGFDAATLGNHGFDYGWRQVRLFLETANYPIVSGNVVDGEGRLMTSAPYVILKVNGLRIAASPVILGSSSLITADKKDLSSSFRGSE